MSSRVEGFASIPIWMMREKDVSRRAVLVYASLSSRAGLGAIYPSQATIAEESGVSERTVRAALQELEDLGVIERRVRRGREGRATGLTTAYLLHPNGRHEEPAELAGSRKGPAKGPATSDKGTGKSEQSPLYEEDNQEVDRENTLAVASFDDFWAVWPRKDSRKAAEAAWGRAVKRADATVILEVARAYAASPFRPERQFVPHGATWLNGDRWNDPLPEAPTGFAGPNDRMRAGLEMGARLQAQFDAQRGIGA